MANPTDGPLTTTSFAILGLLAIKPWTTYELAQQMDRGVGQMWPRTASKLYEEPKKLVALGLAKAAAEQVGRRPRTRYSITAKGRRALAEWMKDPGAGPLLEYEQLVKVFFAENGTKQDLLEIIAAAREWSQQRMLAGGALSRGYLEGKGQFPERLPWLILVSEFLGGLIDLVDEWSTWAASIVEQWPDDVHLAEPDWPTLERRAAKYP